MTKETLQKLEQAFSDGATDKEAIFYAGISSATFYAYCKEHPEFSERCDDLREQIKLQAKRNIVKKINDGDVSISQWYAERKIKGEYSTRTEQTGADGQPVVIQVVSFDDYNTDKPKAE